VCQFSNNYARRGSVRVRGTGYCQFLPRDAMHKLTRPVPSFMRCLSVHLSVCPSVTFVDHVKTNKHRPIFEIFSPSGSHTIHFPYQTGWRYSDGNPITGASNAGGV